MASLTLTERIDAAPHQVFEVFADLRRAADHIRNITAIEVLDDGPVGLNTRFRETRLMFGRPCTETMQITAWDPPRSYSVSCDSCGARFETVFDFRPQGSGTEVTMRFSTTPLSFMARIMGVFSAMMLSACRKSLAADLADLKAVAEGRPPLDAGRPVPA
jgi:hypothetical protein